jgi:hypothetical protein
VNDEGRDIIAMIRLNGKIFFSMEASNGNNI